MKRVLVLLATCVTVAALVVYGASPAEAEQCGFITPTVRVRVDSCNDREDARWAFHEARRALAIVPEPLRPAAVVVHVASKAERAVELDVPSGELVMSRGARFDRSVWLHELLHVRVLRQRASGFLTARIHRAVEEGVADYFAAVISGSPKLGRLHTGRITRDLSAPTRPSEAAWAQYFLPNRDPDPHELGENLARLLWQRAPGSLLLLEDLVAMLAASDVSSPSDRPMHVFAELVASCPERSRAELTGVLSAWVPRELWP